MLRFFLEIRMMLIPEESTVTPELLWTRYLDTRDESAFRDLYPMIDLDAAARRLVRRIRDAEDIKQDAWVRLLRIGKLRKSKVEEALRRFVRDAAVDLWRKEKTRGVERDESAFVDRSSTPEEGAIMARLLDVLPKPERAVVRLVKLDGYTVRESARILGVPWWTAKRRLRAGLRNLRCTFSGT